MRLFKRILIVLGLLVLLGAGWVVHAIGPRNIVGMLRYDRRREGSLKVGDRAPDVRLGTLEPGVERSLLDPQCGKPLILIFGSYT